MIEMLIYAFAGVLVVGGLVLYYWGQIREGLIWDALRQARGWKAGEDTFFDVSWELDTGAGPARVKVGRASRRWVMVAMEFGAPFPQHLTITERVLPLSGEPDRRFGEAGSPFHRGLKVSAPAQAPGVERLARAGFGELLVALRKRGARVELRERRLKLEYVKTLFKTREELEAFVERQLEAAQTIAEMAGLQGGENQPVPEPRALAQGTSLREKRSTGHW
ncbi:hypothetical protein DL240_09035 [Lujinxingia litoralis]|uniref:Uncharacterized protein n=2 Tax=Lujinxingia litoralis TaxID=2211119 RepID=A0A328C7G7_9DELT|nr:hypothetical protein DL240_09035 [Lujinxingia litoralis]